MRGIRQHLEEVRNGYVSFNFPKGTQIIYPEDVFSLEQWETRREDFEDCGNDVYIGVGTEGNEREYFAGHNWIGTEASDNVETVPLSEEQFEASIKFYEDFSDGEQLEYKLSDHDEE